MAAPLSIVAALARRADAALAYRAARNAASCVRDQNSRRLDDARLLRELPPVTAVVPQRRAGG